MDHNQEIHNDPDPGLDKPHEEEIQTMLRDFLPTPSARFYTRIGSAPWTVGRKPSGLQTSRRPRFSGAYVSVLAVLLLILGALAFPPVQAAAQRVAQFFLRSGSDRSAISVTPDETGQFDAVFSLTLEEAAAQAGFPIHGPVELPPFLHLRGAVYLPESRAVILDYRTESSNQIVRLTQQWVGEVESIASIGASAEVEAVRIGNLDGEYVSGGWRHPRLATPLANAVPGMKITLEANWDSNPGIQILRWQQGDMLYELLSISATTPAATNLNKAELIAIAVSME